MKAVDGTQVMQLTPTLVALSCSNSLASPLWVWAMHLGFPVLPWSCEIQIFWDKIASSIIHVIV